MTQTVSGGVEALRAGMDGPMIVPGDADYDEARKVWNADIDRRPGVIARCASATDVVSTEVVTADGRVLRAAADEHPDLFWALRGGGGNFGVVTEFEFRLHEVDPMVGFGLFFWSLDQGPDRAWVRDFWEALRPHAIGSGEGYVNTMIEYGEDRLRATYGPAKYDPSNFFHLNGNIKPG